MASLERGVRRLQGPGSGPSGTATGFEKFATSVARLLSRFACFEVPTQIQDALVGMAGRVANAGTTAGDSRFRKGRRRRKSRSSNACTGTPTGSLPPARTHAHGRLKVGLYLRRRRRRAIRWLRCLNEQAAILAPVRRWRTTDTLNTAGQDWGLRLQRRRSRNRSFEQYSEMLRA